MTTTRRKLFTKDIVVPAIWASFRKLDPRVQVRNPVMFVVEVGSAITTGIFLADLVRGRTDDLWFTGVVALWLWLTVLFANFAEAVAEGRGKAQANALRATQSEMMARRLAEGGREESVPAVQLRPGDLVVCEAGDLIPGDGEVVEGVASVDESAITGESAPVIREAGGDRSAVTGGTRVLSDRIVVRITQEPGQSFLDRMIALVEGTSRRKTPNEIALNILITGLTVVFLVVTATLRPMVTYAGSEVSLTVLIALLVALIPTTIGALLSAIGIAGMDRLVQRNVLAMSGRAVEAAGDVNTLLLDKTGTITLGNRQASEFIPAAGVTERELADAAQLASLADETPEGRSIVVLAKQRFDLRERGDVARLEFVPFSAETRMSGVQTDETSIRKGASDAIQSWVGARGGAFPTGLQDAVDVVARSGGTPLVVARDAQALGVIHLKDVVKEGMPQRFTELRRMGIRTVMITGDNRLTAAAIAAEAGVDDFLAQATPEDKMRLIREEQGKGYLVAMTGDGTNDAPALAQADVGVAMNTGTSAAKEAGNMVDLDSDPTKLIEIVEVGKQLLITRGSLTTFSIANDVAKYFAILPAIFATSYAAEQGGKGPLDALNVMDLGTPQSAIISAIVFNALVIPALVPLALRGVRYRAIGATRLLRRNLLIYGLGGVIAPFIGIKLIDLVVHNLLGRDVGGGRLKVYVGMAAGVGKTYEMLEEAQDLRRAGRDVVIGWLEPHGRAETSAMAEGLELVPPLEIDHRGVPLRDMDTAAVIARAPEIALVDELAHTNAPGMPHAKRFEDVADLREAGIDVLSTVNVQHLESLNDRVYELTGVRVRETIPDQVVLDADDVVLVDLTPEELQARVRAGKIYPAERVEAALLNFFTTANLGTLREVALREVAGAVDEQIQRAGPRRGAPAPEPANAPLAERVMVIARPEKGAQRLVRQAWRAARRLGAELDIVCPEGRLDEEGVRQRDLLRSLAVTLGAHFLPVPDDALAETVVGLVHERGVTRLAMAAPRGRGLMSRVRGDLLTALLERLEGVDLMLMAERPEPRERGGR